MVSKWNQVFILKLIIYLLLKIVLSLKMVEYCAYGIKITIDGHLKEILNEIIGQDYPHQPCYSRVKEVTSQVYSNFKPVVKTLQNEFNLFSKKTFDYRVKSISYLKEKNGTIIVATIQYNNQPPMWCVLHNSTAQRYQSLKGLTYTDYKLESSIDINQYCEPYFYNP
jgi:hypothetical protein